MSATSKEPEAKRVQGHFRTKARSFDRLYDEEGRLQRFLRPALSGRADLAVSIVEALERPRVLDVGCGSGRVGERTLEAGASHYVGIDFSAPMLELALERLDRFGDKARARRRRLPDGAPVRTVRGDPRARPLRLHARAGALHAADVRALLRRRRGELPALDVGQGPCAKAPLRSPERLPDLRLLRRGRGAALQGQRVLVGRAPPERRKRPLAVARR